MQNLEKINIPEDFLLNGSMNKQAVKMIGFESLVLYSLFIFF